MTRITWLSAVLVAVVAGPPNALRLTEAAPPDGEVVPAHAPAAPAAAEVAVNEAALDQGAAEPHSASADEIVAQLEREAFDWFQAHRHPETGAVLDRGKNKPGAAPAPGDKAMSSIAATGFYLAMLPHWVERGWLDRPRAEELALQSVRFTRDHVAHHRGLLCHFVDWRTGERWDRSEFSVLDSALYLNGAMTAASAFGGDVARLTNETLDRIEWPEFIVERDRVGKLLSFGYSPEQGLLGPIEIRSDELLMPIVLGCGSATHPLDPDVWRNCRIDAGLVAGRLVMNPGHPLFTSNYGLAWHGLRGVVDRDGVDLVRNAREMALANRDFCRAKAATHRTYAPEQGGWWCISAGDAPWGYAAPGPVDDHAKGVAWPLAALAAWPWIPEELAADLPQWRASPLWDKAHGPYGLSPIQDTGDSVWVGEDILGIDLGSFTIGMVEHRDQSISRLWNAHPVAARGWERLGFRPAKR